MPRQTTHFERESLGRPAVNSILLHLGIMALLALLIYWNGRHGAEWGNNAPPGAIQATMVSSAPAIPLPSITPPTPNVLATQLPSPAPAPPSKATIPLESPDAIPIPTRHPRLRHVEKPHPASPRHAQPLRQTHRAKFGEAPPTQLNHALTNAPAHTNSPVNVNGGDFSSRFPWYVDKITRIVSQSWYTQEIDPGTPYGSQVSVTFTIGRDGSVSNIHISQPSNSPTLNSTAVQAVQRVETFGNLPDAYRGSHVSVEYTFTYDQPTH